MKYFSIYFLFVIISCLLILQTNALFGGGDGKTKESSKPKAENKGQCSLYKGRCGGTLKNTCCKVPYKCSKQTKICGKDKLCCVTEADIQRHKQESGGWVADRNGK